MTEFSKGFATAPGKTLTMHLPALFKLSNNKEAVIMKGITLRGVRYYVIYEGYRSTKGATSF